MQKHDHFEELCSLAVIGELSADETAEFTAHMRNCGECQANFLDLSTVASEQLSLVVGYPQSSGRRSFESVRSGALERIAAEGLRITPEALKGRSTGWQRVLGSLEDFRWVLAARRRQLAVSLTFVALILVGLWAARQERENQERIALLNAELAQVMNNTKEAMRPVVTTPAAADSSVLEKKIADAGARIARLEAEKTENLKTISSLHAGLERLSLENSNLAAQSNSSQSEAAALRSQIEQLRAKVTSAEAEVTAAQYQVTSLSSELKTQQAAVDHETELLAAGRDIRDLMGARDLHIIDVHDMDAHGEARPFGRIFLTEGKRLIFYAYDLDSPKRKNATFQAWGQRADGNQAAVNLGILYMDDQRQARWALKVEDPHLLSAIDSLFVTVEPPGGAAQPAGKKLMYAYLKNPINHP